MAHDNPEKADERDCEAFYGRSYLEYPATHQTPYCETHSPSGLQCFNVRRQPNPHPWHIDTFCMGQGVSLKQGTIVHPETQETIPRTHIDLNCQLRNFTAERLESAEAAARLKDINNILDLPEYFYWTGTRNQLFDWNKAISEESKCSIDGERNNGKTILLARREDNNNIFHKFMEIWQAALTVDMLRVAINPRTGQPYLSQLDVENARIAFEDERDEPYQSWWDMVLLNGHKPMRKSDLADDCYNNVILPLPGSSSPFWTIITEGPWIPSCRNEFLVRNIRKRFFKQLGLTPRPRDDLHLFPNITIIDRKKSREIEGLDHLMQMVKRRYPGANINVVDFATISVKQQVQLVMDTDILIGVHGAALFHLLWLQPEASLVEIRPPGTTIQGFRRYATILGTNYFSVYAVWPEIWNNTLNGVPYPEGWVEPDSNADWQTEPFTYVLPDEFVGAVSAAVTAQDHRLPPNRDKEKYINH
ncbi:hypothetical protein UCRPC4_g01611 [Phaeomoniella chlamydospora]|uniref:EGF domain-specific O-linked N-acetylglucosamine transferase n=1 Tax=Phaeomoniella chlamydospora TaxID=158046 RepID=A0A0G2GQS2_PHACM|nr:hypothetical protein UCRPC4_g01611 [Phaeomoniella chlamydospora]